MNLWAKPTQVSSLLKRLAVLEAPVLLEMVQLWTVLSRLGQRSESGRRLPEVPYLEAWAHGKCVVLTYLERICLPYFAFVFDNCCKCLIYVDLLPDSAFH